MTSSSLWMAPRFSVSTPERAASVLTTLNVRVSSMMRDDALYIGVAWAMINAISATATRPEPTIRALRRLSSHSHFQSSLRDAAIGRRVGDGRASTGAIRLRSPSSPIRSILGRDPITHHPASHGPPYRLAYTNHLGVAADRAGMALPFLRYRRTPNRRHRTTPNHQNHRSGTRITSPGSTSVSSVTNSSSAKFEKKRRIVTLDFDARRVNPPAIAIAWITRRHETYGKFPDRATSPITKNGRVLTSSTPRRGDFR